ncbi:MAG: hypothetical protein LBR12_05400 [Opitutaceae bacterium]|jgi:hypothetical protein|nr:hypothetical protein [Opitutaceae bacterium]
MAKIDLNQVAAILHKRIEPDLLKQILEEMRKLVEEEAQEAGNADKPPQQKKQFCILVSDPEGDMPDKDLAGWVLQIPEDESVKTATERIFQAAHEYNRSKKGRLQQAKTVGEAIEIVPSKHFKEAGLWVKTKSPVLILRTDNEIPKDGGEKDARRGRY